LIFHYLKRGIDVRIRLSYGLKGIELDIPRENLAGVIEPATSLKPFADPVRELVRVIENPHGDRLDQIAAGRSVCVLVEDHTRNEPHSEMLDAITPYLTDASHVEFIVATGSHEVDHPENLRIVTEIERAASEASIDDYRVSIHDCHDTNMVRIGDTSRGTPVIINSRAAHHDVYVVLADMKAHYFAGYSNALKDFLPGICAFESIEANHAMALDPNSTFGRHPYHPDPRRRNNPLADDMREAMEMITRGARVFTLSVISSDHKVLWADAGLIRPVTERGIQVLDENSSFTVRPTTRIIVSPGGYPEDKSLYHAQRALELTKNAVRDGGEVLFLAECKDGVAPPEATENFYQRLRAPLDTVLASISERYHLYEHKAYKFAELLKRVSTIKMYTELQEDLVDSVHMQKVNDAQGVVDQWISQDPGVQILVFDKGNKLAVYSEA
ncbi:MAG: lactate racemase domain-containing protein, partial [Candidatus Thorarchaeota archaeon]